MKLNPKYIPYIIAVLAIIVAGFYYQKVQTLKIKDQIDEQNLAAETDSLRIELNKKTGEMEASKAAWIISEKDLRDSNNFLSDEVDKTKGKVVTLNRLVFKLKQDTIMLRNALKKSHQEAPEQLNDSTYNIPWNLFYAYDSVNNDYFEGVTQIRIGVGSPYKVKHLFTELRRRESTISLTFGQRVEGEKLRVFARSDYPGFTPTQLEGVLIEPNTNPFIKGLIRKKHWLTGFGVGPNITMGYDFVNATPAVIFGIGLQYNIYQW